MIYKQVILILYTCSLIALICIDRAEGIEYYTEKPSFLPSCQIYEPGFTKCSTKSVQKLLDQLAVGIPEITETFGPIDPQRVNDIMFKQDNSEIVTLRANLTHVAAKGFSKIIVKQSRVSKKDFSWETKLLVPRLRIDADYQMEGRILLIPLQGNGKLFLAMENLDIVLYTKTRLYDKGGFTFDNVTGVRVDLNITRLQTYFDNLFNGKSKEVERSTNQFFNENWPELYQALKPIIYKTIEESLFNFMSKIFNLIPANFFVTDIPTAEKFYGKKSPDKN